MNEKPIIITVENYNGQKITFVMSTNAEIESTYELSAYQNKITAIHIDVYDENIFIEKEKLNGI